ncbi:hypothetical protein PAPYR_6122 [Paratrimastix pyriformis]|uniref:Uncharacterized protein n=1 Tax=Paratrimastix pyriformis TaxID=342808 RepID=A0ABQ8UL07_9EUKA|nr:hypothetical protein PAPYR_6122 [Paratrimastix pyriformis]
MSDPAGTPDAPRLDCWENVPLPPSVAPRFAHCLVRSSRAEFLSVCGYTPGKGLLSDISTYNIETGTWVDKCIVCAGPDGSPQWLADAAPAARRPMLCDSPTDESGGLNDMQRLALAEGKWAEQRLPGGVPAPRPTTRRTFMFAWGDSLYIYDQRSPNFLSRFQLPPTGPPAWKQRVVTTGAVTPQPRDFGCCCVAGGVLYVFGGMAERSRRCLGDLFALDLATLRWEELPPAAGLPPTPRFDAAMGAAGSDDLYVFGGCDDRDMFFGDLYRFHVPRRVWMPVAVCPPAPVAIASPASPGHHPGTVAPGPCPQPRAQAGCVIFPRPSWHELYIFGGHLGERHPLGDMYRIRVRPTPISEAQTARIKAETPQPQALAMAAPASRSPPPGAKKPTTHRSPGGPGSATASVRSSAASIASTTSAASAATRAGHPAAHSSPATAARVASKPVGSATAARPAAKTASAAPKSPAARPGQPPRSPTAAPQGRHTSPGLEGWPAQQGSPQAPPLPVGAGTGVIPVGTGAGGDGDSDYGADAFEPTTARSHRLAASPAAAPAESDEYGDDFEK